VSLPVDDYRFDLCMTISADAPTEVSEAARAMPMVDAHHHLWDLDRFRYDWLSGDGVTEVADSLGDYAPIRINYLINELLGDFQKSNIVKSVHVQADISEPDPVVETRWLQSIADTFDYPHAIVAYCDLLSPTVGEQLDRHCASPNMRGVRVPNDVETLTASEMYRGVAELAFRNLSLEADASAHEMASLARLATAFEGVTFFLGHTGFPQERSDEYFTTWRSAIRETAAIPNIAIKISGLGMGDHHWTSESIRPFVLESINAFGPDRCVFGTNWPVDRLYSDLPTLTDAFRALIATFSPDEQANLLRRNAERLYALR
jgi:predicted TIM-barrel fold metal-dependent hydrolase